MDITFKSDIYLYITAVIVRPFLNGRKVKMSLIFRNFEFLNQLANVSTMVIML